MIMIGVIYGIILQRVIVSLIIITWFELVININDAVIVWSIIILGLSLLLLLSLALSSLE